MGRWFGEARIIITFLSTSTLSLLHTENSLYKENFDRMMAYMDVTIRKAIEEVVQLNQGQEYSYNRDELVKMLEESMAKHP